MDDGGEPVDDISPWTIKAVSRRTREAVTLAARQEGLTVGQWLEKRVMEWQGQGSPVTVAGALPAAAASLGELAEAMAAARALSESAGVAIPPAMAREAISVVRRAMRIARGLPPPAARRKPQVAIKG